MHSHDARRATMPHSEGDWETALREHREMTTEVELCYPSFDPRDDQQVAEDYLRFKN